MSHRATSYSAELEPLSACLRVFDEDARPGTDPYVASGSVVWIDRHTVEIKGVAVIGRQSLSIEMRAAVFASLRSMGVQAIRFRRRRRDGSEKVVTIPIDKFGATPTEGSADAERGK